MIRKELRTWRPQPEIVSANFTDFWLDSVYQRHFNEMFAEEPNLKLVGAKHVADDHIICTVVAQSGSAFRENSAMPDDDLVRIQKT